MWRNDKASLSINSALIGVLISAAVTPWLLKQEDMLKWAFGALFAAILISLVVRCIRTGSKSWAKAAFALTVSVYWMSFAIQLTWGWGSDARANAHTVVLLITLLILLGLSSFTQREDVAAE